MLYMHVAWALADSRLLLMLPIELAIIALRSSRKFGGADQGAITDEVTAGCEEDASRRWCNVCHAPVPLLSSQCPAIQPYQKA